MVYKDLEEILSKHELWESLSKLHKQRLVKLTIGVLNGDYLHRSFFPTKEIGSSSIHSVMLRKFFRKNGDGGYYKKVIEPYLKCINESYQFGIGSKGFTKKYLLQDWVSDKCMDTLQNDTKPCELSVIDKRPKPINKLPKNGLVDRDIDGHPCTSKIQINPLVQVNTTMLNNTIEELNNVSPLKIRKKSVYERHLIPLLQVRQSINNKRFPMNLLQLYQESQNGRISPMKNLDFPHLINIPPNVRLVMFSDMGYYDYDMSNSHLSIFNELCKKYDFIPQGIEEYINNKRYHRERWSYDFCIKEKVIKEYIISWLYGNGMNPIIHNPFYKDLGYERMMKIKDDDLLNTIYQDIIKGRRIVIENQQIVDNHYVNIMDKRYPTKKTKGQILCFFLFGYESKILEIVNDVIGDDMKVMIYDGWIGKKTNIKYLESEVKNRLGIGIKFDEELIERPPIQKMY